MQRLKTKDLLLLFSIGLTCTISFASASESTNLNTNITGGLLKARYRPVCQDFGLEFVAMTTL